MTSPPLDHLIYLFTSTAFPTFAVNSIIIGLLVVAIPLGIAYGLLFDYLVRGFQSAGAGGE